MARSEPKAKKLFFANHPFISLLCLVAILMLITAGVATVVQQAFLNQSSAESPQETQGEGAVSPADTAPTPPTTDLETGDETDNTSCLAVLPPEQFAQLSTRILDFEEARLQPDFYEDQATMRVHATENFIANNLRTETVTEVSDISAILDREQTVIACFVISETRVIVQAVDAFSTYRTDSSGAGILVNQFTGENPSPVHNTGWELQNGEWYVDSAQR